MKPTAQNVRDVRELALGIELERRAALDADAADLVFCAAYHRANVESREALLLDHARRCELTLGPVAPRTCDELPAAAVTTGWAFSAPAALCWECGVVNADHLPSSSGICETRGGRP